MVRRKVPCTCHGLISCDFLLTLHQERNDAVARYTAYDYSTRIASLTDRLPQQTPQRPRSASIEQDILRTLNESPLPSNGHRQFPEDVSVPEHPMHHNARGKGKRRTEGDVDSVMVKTEVDGASLSRKRKVDEIEEMNSDAPSSVAVPAKKKSGKQKKVPTGEEGPKAPRKRGPRKTKTTPATSSKLPSEEPQHPQHPITHPHPNRLSPSIAGSVGFSLDATPIPSTPSSPTLTAISSLGYGPGFWPLEEPVPSLKRSKKLEPSQAAKRIVTLEESQRRVWLSIARKDVVRVCSFTLCFISYPQNPIRRTSTMPQDTLSRIVTTNVLRAWLLHRLAKPAHGQQSLLRTPRRERSDSCVKCLCFGKRMNVRSATFGNVLKKKLSIAPRKKKRSVRRPARLGS